MTRQLTTYALVGASNVIVTLGVLNLLVVAFDLEGGWPLLAASAAAFVAAVCNSYIWNSRYTFPSKQRARTDAFPRFVAVHIGTLVLNQVIFAAVAYPLITFGDQQANIASTLAQTTALVATFVANFVALRLWAFR